jgi:polyphosphate kinase 2 (PPK2 family)
VHPELLERQKLPATAMEGNIWKERFDDINAFERYLTRNGVLIRKFFLHVSKQEQKERFLARLEDPNKNWKFSDADLPERARWSDYMGACEDMVRHTATPWAPWYVVPADHKWFTRLVVAEAIIDALESLDLRYPRVDALKRRQLAAIAKQLRGARNS